MGTADPRDQGDEDELRRQTVATGVTGAAHRAGQTQRRRGQQEARAAVLAQPLRELGEIPELAERHAELEQAQLVQPLVGPAVVAARGRHGFDREVVGGDRGDARRVDPSQQALVAAVEMAERILEPPRAPAASPCASSTAVCPVCRHRMSPRSTTTRCASSVRIRSS